MIHLNYLMGDILYLISKILLNPTLKHETVTDNPTSKTYIKK